MGLVLPGFIATEGFPPAELRERRLTRWLASDAEAAAEAIVDHPGAAMTSRHEIDIPQLPPDEEINRLVGLLGPTTRITQPKVYGIHNVPESHALLVGNQRIYGFLDLPFTMAALWQQRRITVRGLGGHVH